ncbi:hypothetical protein ACFLUB_00870 [Chloroflexota bacterium]
MHNCPNCGRPTYRTEDWACQWCGYPLLSKAYKKIPKTFQQLQEERRSPVVSEPIPEIGEVPEPTPMLEPEPIPEPEPAVAAEIEPEQAPMSEEEAVPEMEAASEPEPIIESESEQEPFQETAQEVTAPPIPEPIPEPKAIEPAVSVPGAVTVEELDASFQADMIAADAVNRNKVLTLSGVVDKVVVNENHEIYYCILAGLGRKVVWNIRCTFDKRNGAELKRLARGQAAVVQGKYDGYSKNIILKDCVVLS